MTIKLFLDETALRVGITTLSKNCPSFKEDFPSQVRSRVGFEVFHIFVEELESATPILTTENKHELPSLCSEFGFPGLLSQVTISISGQPVVDGARKDANGIREENLQIRQALYPLQEVFSRLTTHEKEQKALKRQIVSLREARQRASRVEERNLEMTDSLFVGKEVLEARG
jgi:hypothetical protein